MRIVSGTARGRRLGTPVGMDIRPTTDKVKEALFSIIQFDLQDKMVLDMFAGTGQLGLEALSRGAKFVYFTDASKKAIELVKSNIRVTGFDAKAKAVLTDSFSFVSNTSEQFDIVLIDPPYEQGLCRKAAEVLPGALSEDAIVICETRETETLPDKIGHLKLYKEYKYSAIKLSVYRNLTSED